MSNPDNKESEIQTSEPNSKDKIGFKIPGFAISYDNQLLSFEIFFFSGEIGVRYLSSFFAFLIRVFQGFKNIICRNKKTSIFLVSLIFILSLMMGAFYYKLSLEQQNARMAFKSFRLGAFTDARKSVSKIWFNQSLSLKAKLISHLYRGDLIRAEKILKTIQLEHSHEMHQYVLEGHILFLKNRLDEAALLYSKVIQTPETNRWVQSEALWGRSRIFSKNNSYKNALHDLDKALEIDPEFVMAYTNKGIVFEKQNKLVRAMKQYLEAMHVIKKNTVSQANNTLFFINDALYKKVKVMADCDNSDSCIIKLEAQTQSILRHMHQSKAEQKELKTHRFIFCPLEIQGQNEFLSGETLYFSDIILNKIDASAQFDEADPLAIYGLMKRFQKPIYMTREPKIASKLGKYLSTDVIIGGQILRENASIQITLYAIDSKTAHKYIHETKSLDFNQDIKTEIETLTLNFLRGLKNEILVSDQ